MLDLIGKAQAIVIPKVTPGAVGSGGDFKAFVGGVADWIVWFAAALVVIYLVYGGILYITAGGDAEKATKGRTAVINAIIGLVIVLLALIIIKWVTTIVGKGTVS